MGARVLVFGASGNVGSVLVGALAGRGAGVRAFFDPATSRPVDFPDGVEEVHASFDDAAAVNAAVQGADAVFMLTPPSASQTRWQQTIVDACERSATRRLVKLSAFETAADSPLQMGRWHHEGELALERSACEHVIIRPQYFMQNLAMAMGEAVRTGVLRHAAAPGTRLGLVDVADIAAVAAVALLEPGHAGAVLRPTGPRALSFDDVAAELAAVAGREIIYEQRPAGDLAAEFRGRGWPDWHVEDFLLIHGAAASPEVTPDVAEVTGRAPRDFSSFLRRWAPSAV